MRGTDLLCLLNMRKADATNARHADALMPATESMSVSLSMGTSLKFWSLGENKLVSGFGNIGVAFGIALECGMHHGSAARVSGLHIGYEIA